MNVLTNSLNAFGGIITAVAAWSIWGQGDMFPREADPTGGKLLLIFFGTCCFCTVADIDLDPEIWTREEMRRWLAAVSSESLLYISPPSANQPGVFVGFHCLYVFFFFFLRSSASYCCGCCNEICTSFAVVLKF